MLCAGKLKFRAMVVVVAALVAVSTVFVAAGAVHAATLTVSPSGSYRSIQAAVNAARAGDTIVVEAGRYRESVTVSKQLNIVARPGAVLDGSVPVTGWVADGGDWWVRWTQNLPRIGSPFIDASRPEAGWLDQVFIGTSTAGLLEVRSRDAVVPGTFYVDLAAQRLWLGSNPTGVDVHASVLSSALHIIAAGTTVTGPLVVERYAVLESTYAAVRAHADRIVVDGMVVRDNSFNGLFAMFSDVTLRNVTADRNGMMGIAGFRADRLRVENSKITNNNASLFGSGHSSSGLKITTSKNVMISGNVASGNRATGLWVDGIDGERLNIVDATIVNNVAFGNDRHGIFVELVDGAVVANNVSYDNGTNALWVIESIDVKVWHNTLLSSRAETLNIQDGPRYRIANIEVFNNVIGHTAARSQAPFRAWNWQGVRSASDLNITADNNSFWAAAGTPTLRWDTTSHSTAAAHRAACRCDGASTFNTRLWDATASLPTGRALPADVAEALGRPVGTYQVGAFGQSSQPPSAPTTTVPATTPPAPTTPPPPAPPIPSTPTSPSSAVTLLQPVLPTRLLDTRTPPAPFAAGETRMLQVAGVGPVPAVAKAANLNVVAVNQRTPGFLTVWPCQSRFDPRPNTSNLNFDDRSATANNNVVTLGSSGAVCVFSHVAADVIVDVTAVYVDEVYGGSRLSVRTPERVVDTRIGLGAPRSIGGGGVIRVRVADRSATAAALNITAVGTTQPGYITAWSCSGVRPPTSTLNFVAQSARANSAVVELSQGDICLYAHTDVDVVIDSYGSFSASGELAYQPVSPFRTLDTRPLGKLRPLTSRAVPLNAPSSQVRAANVNVAGLAAQGPGWMAAHPCSTGSNGISSLNQQPGQAVSATATMVVERSGSSVSGCVTSNNEADVVVDVTGWWVATA